MKKQTIQTMATIVVVLAAVAFTFAPPLSTYACIGKEVCDCDSENPGDEDGGFHNSCMTIGGGTEVWHYNCEKAGCPYEKKAYGGGTWKKCPW